MPALARVRPVFLRASAPRRHRAGRGNRHGGILPTGPVRVIVPFGAGGATDALARVFIDRLQQRLGQTFTAENRGGAGGQIAAAAFRAPRPMATP